MSDHDARRAATARVLAATIVVATTGLSFIATEAATPIDTSQAFYLQSNVGTTVLPDFQGGTLRDNQASATDSHNFSVENFATNTIDAFGHSALFNGTFSGAGPLTIVDSVGGGTVALAGVDTYSGTTTITSGATLQLGDGAGNAGLLGGPITDNGSIVFNAGSGTFVEYFTGITGTGSLTQASGTLELSGANTYSGSTTINTGATLQIGGSGSIASSAGVADNGTFDISPANAGVSISSLSGSGVVTLGANTLALTNASGTFSGGISGSGGLTIAAGTETLSGISSFSGTTTVDTGATLRLGDGAGNAGLLGGPITDNGTIVSDAGNGTLVAYFTNITGTGDVTLASGTLEIVGVESYTGTTTVDSGATLMLGDSAGNAGLLTGAITDNGTIDFSAGSGTFVIYATSITGTGNATVANGTLALAGTNTFTGATTINLGATLQLGAGGTTGTLAGPIIDNGLLSFDYSGPVTVSSLISGSGNVEVATGTVVETSVSAVSGTVTIDSGATLQWGDGSAAAFLIGGNAVTDNGALVINFGSSGGVGGPILISGTGSVTLQSGELSDSAVSTYTGSTTIDAGNGTALILTGTGSIASSSGVIDNGTLDISGTTAGTSITTLSGSGTVSLGAQTLTITAGSSTFSGVLADGGFSGGTGGGLTIAGGTETLSGTNTFTGTTTINLGATLQLGAGGTTGTVAGPITDNGLLSFDYSGPVIVSSLISGSGNLEVVAGTVVETSASSLGGTVTIDNGATLQWGNNNAAFLTGGGNAVTDNGALVLDFGGGGVGGSIPISGSGSVTIESGSLNDSAASTYTGATTIDANALLLLSTAGSIASSSNVIDNGTFDISGTTAGTAITTLSGSGTVSLGAQTLTITAGSSTFSGILADGGLFGGTGGSLIIAGGTETLSGANTFSGNTSVLGGTLSAGAVNTFSPNSILVVSAPGNVALNGFNQIVAGIAGNGNIALGSATLTTTSTATQNFAGMISGGGGLTVGGTGIQILSGNNTYTGPTTINAGTLQAGIANTLSGNTDVTVAGGATFDLNGFDQAIGSLAGAGDVALGSATLTTNGDNATTTFSGAIAGTGGLTKTGGGELFLTGISTFTGATLVDGGVLSVNGTLASAVTVNAGATLKGIGTVAGVTVGSGGTIAPGNSIGTLHVAGNVNLGAGSTYQVEVNAAGQSDLISATGTATLNGGTVQVVVAPGAYTAETTYTILTAGSVTGTFSSVISSNAFYQPSLIYKPAEVDLSLLSVATFARTPNQIAVANALQTAPGVVGAAIGALPASQIPGAFDATSGEIHASVRTALLEDGQTLRNTVLSRLHDAQGTGVWGRLFGTWGEVDGDGNAARLDTNFSGLTVGVDAPFDGGFRAGAEAGYGLVQGHIGDTRDSSLNSDSFHAGVYGGYGSGPLSFNVGVIGSWGTVRTDREVRIGSFSDSDRANQASRTTQAFGEAAYSIPLNSVDLTPFVNGGWIEANTGHFTETGGAAALSGTNSVSDETFSTLGLRLSTDIALSDGSDIAPTASAGWLHDFRYLTPARALAFIATGANFTVLGVPIDQDQAVITAGVVAHPAPGATITLGYQGMLSNRVTNNGLELSVAWEF
ncbi:MAG TPA: autotransporter domain-containing protein [Rhizomicrobium sp.]|nr:autotransporter domain-containing protein [Rhizomicrobium sp.]